MKSNAANTWNKKLLSTSPRKIVEVILKKEKARESVQYSKKQRKTGGKRKYSKYRSFWHKLRMKIEACSKFNDLKWNVCKLLYYVMDFPTFSHKLRYWSWIGFNLRPKGLVKKATGQCRLWYTVATPMIRCFQVNILVCFLSPIASQRALPKKTTFGKVTIRSPFSSVN